MHLYELTTQMQGLQALIDSGEMAEIDLLDTMEGLQGDIQDKGRGALAVMANLASDSDAYDREIKRMQARKNTIDKNRMWLVDYLRNNMILSGVTKIESDVFSATLRAPTVIVDLVEPSLVPAPYRTEETVVQVKIDKAMIKKDLKSGKDIPGAKLADGKQALIIR